MTTDARGDSHTLASRSGWSSADVIEAVGHPVVINSDTRSQNKVRNIVNSRVWGFKTSPPRNNIYKIISAMTHGRGDNVARQVAQLVSRDLVSNGNCVCCSLQ